MNTKLLSHKRSPLRSKRLGIAAACLGLVGPLLAPVAVSAQQQNEIVLSVDFDGTAAFSAADPLDDGAGGHTPGLDLNANNNVIRTYDQIQYRIDWNVNEVDGTTTTIAMTLPEGMEWMPDATTVSGVPSGCLDDGTSSITGLDGRELICNTDAEHEGSNGAIHPRAFVSGHLDGTVLAVEASVETDQAPPVVSNPIETTVSAAPGGDWIKGKPLVDADSGEVIAYEPNEEYFDVPDVSGAPGALIVWNLRLEPAGGLKGSEPLNDSIDLEFWDHFFEAPAGARLATPAEMLAATGLPRVACGGYDGDGGYPFGMTAGGAATPAGQTNTGTITCTDLGTSATGYPLVKFDITGQDTTNIASQNADLSTNNTTLVSAQVAFWIPNPPFNTPVEIVNAITGSDAAVAAGSSEVDPIQVHGTNGPVDEVSESGSGLAGISNGSPYAIVNTPPGSPGRSVRHLVTYKNGPYQEVEQTDAAGNTWAIFDYRADTLGGTGRVVTNGSNGVNENSTRWDGDGQTPRGNILTVFNSVATITSNDTGVDWFAPIHSCVAVDTTHQEVIGMPASFPISFTNSAPSHNPQQQAHFFAQPTVGGATGTPATPIAQVISSETGSSQTLITGISGPTVQTSSPELDWVLEVAELTDPGNNVALHDVTCNGDEGTWVDASGPGLADLQTDTLPDGTPVYGNVTHFRLRTAGDVPWNSDFFAGNGTWSYGARMHLNFQVRVKDDPAIQVADQELFVYASRAWGDWDGTGQPPTTSCTNRPRFGATDDVTLPLGWCNLPFADDGVDTLDITAPDTKNDYDLGAVEFTFNGQSRLAHADVVYIVEPALAISKVNTDGPSDIVANGQTVEFEINPRVVGSSLDAIHNVTVTDTLPATMSFVGFTSQPSQGTCSVAGQTITCTYGNQNGGWGSLGEGRFAFEVLIQDAGANATLTNTATISGVDSSEGLPVTPASSRAQAFTGAPFEESGIEKAVSDHITTCFEAPGTIHDLGDCTVIAVDGAMVFTLDVENEGNVDLDNYRVIDVLPHLADATEPAAAGHPVTGVALTGDGRTPPSAFTGDLNFLGAVAPAGATILYSADDPTTISRDPAVADSATTWCDAAAGGTAVAAGLAPAAGTNPCPADATEVTAVHFDLGTLDKGATELLEVHLETVGATCGDIWTNNFGARTSGLLLPIRSNDVSVMAGFCDPAIDIEKDTNGLQSDEPTGATIVAGDPVTWTYVVENTGDVALADAVVADSDPAVVVDCDIDGDGALDGTNVIPLLLPGDIVTCESTGVAQAGQYSNNSTVSGNPVLPDFSDPAVDPSDPSTWPTDAAAYSEPLNPVTGAPALEDPEDEDPSHYIGIDPEPAIDIEKDTNGAQSDEAPGNPIVAGAAVTWTYVVANTGTVALADATVTDIDSTGASVVVDCDIDGDGALDGTNVIPLLVPGGSVTCESTGVAGPGPYSNNASVSGNMTLPTGDCVCDPTDPSTWPTDPADYAEYVDPVTGEPVTVDDEDPSHYTGVEPGVDIEKDTNGVQSDEAPGENIAAGDPVTWTYVVTNTGATALLDAAVMDSDPAVVVDCDIDGDGVLDGTNVIPFMAVGDSVTCEGAGTAAPGPYSNTATVAGAPALPDFSDPDLDPSVDPADPSTWPTDPAAYGPAIGPDGAPLAPVDDADDSHYTGTPPIGSLGGVIWDDADGDGIQDPNETVHAGVLVELFDENGDPVLDANGNPITATTDVNGAYVFPDLPPGNYRIKVTAPDGTILTPGAGGDDDVDGTGLSGPIPVGAGEDVRGIDAGLVPAPPSLAFTGSTIGSPIFASALLITIGGLMLLGTRRRRQFIEVPAS